MSKRLFVGNLTPNIDDQELNDLFAEYGTVVKAEVVRGRGGRGRGFGYVEMESDDVATEAIAAVNGREWHGREITVAEARSRRRPSPMEQADSRHGFGGGGGYRRNSSRR